MSAPIYNKQRKESAKAFEAFRIYRDLGPERSLARVGQQLGKSTALMERWSTTWNWVARVDAWDEEQDRRAREAQIKEIEAMNKRHAQVAGVVLAKAVEFLATMLPSQLKPNTALHFIDKAVDIERKARGAPSEIIEQRTKDEQDPSIFRNALKHDDVRKLLAGIGRPPTLPPTNGTPANPTTNAAPQTDVPGCNGDLPHS